MAERKDNAGDIEMADDLVPGYAAERKGTWSVALTLAVAAAVAAAVLAAVSAAVSSVFWEGVVEEEEEEEGGVRRAEFEMERIRRPKI